MGVASSTSQSEAGTEGAGSGPGIPVAAAAFSGIRAPSSLCRTPVALDLPPVASRVSTRRVHGFWASAALHESKGGKCGRFGPTPRVKVGRLGVPGLWGWPSPACVVCVPVQTVLGLLGCCRPFRPGGSRPARE